jgi:conjugative transposon TraM protein
MSINFKQPKYILPLIAIPFLCLFFYVYHSSASKSNKETKALSGINPSVGDVSPEIRKKDLSDKLDAYRNIYKEADGNTAVNAIPAEHSANPSYNNPYTDRQKKTLDSINRAMKARFNSANADPANEKATVNALKGLRKRRTEQEPTQPKEKDPMALFRQQMTYVDSIRKAADPAYVAQKQKQDAEAKAKALQAATPVLAVTKAASGTADFNTVKPQTPKDFITAAIDENVTGYAGSRIRLRLLDDIKAGSNTIPKGTYLYALITGFSGQRVSLAIKTILYNGQLLPVKLEVYDLDGLAGLYVPASQFRDFTKDLGGNTVQGVTIDNSGSGSAASQLLMSTADKMFESTSSAIAGIIRKDKAKLKYNSYIYLIDNEVLNNVKKNL